VADTHTSAESVTGHVARDQSCDVLRSTVADVLGVAVADLTDESSVDSIESWDSLNHLNIVMAIEEAFSVQLSADDVLEMRSIVTIREILRAKDVVI
jgi:acyl carrier protein